MVNIDMNIPWVIQLLVSLDNYDEYDNNEENSPRNISYKDLGDTIEHLDGLQVPHLVS